MTENSLIPNGSIVLLKGGSKKLMIYGRKQLSLKENEQMYDYLAVPYPEGYINPDYSYVFNHSFFILISPLLTQQRHSPSL
jgi:hypothetical protein